jgi:hypothetical protein
MTDEAKNNHDMTAETVAGDLIGMLVGELKLLPDIWVKIGPDEQDDIIERVRKRVSDSVRQAVRLIASAGRITVAGDLKKVTFADKVEAVFSLSKNDPSALELCHAQGLACLIVVASAGLHMGGAGEEAAERQLTLPGTEGDSAEANAILEQVRRRMGKQPPQDDTPPAGEPEAE